MTTNCPSDDAAQRLQAIETWFEEHEIVIEKLRELCKRNGVKSAKKARRGKKGAPKTVAQLKADLLAKLSKASGPKASEVLATAQTFLAALEAPTSSVDKKRSAVPAPPEDEPIAGPSRNPAGTQNPSAEPCIPLRASSTRPNIVVAVGEASSSRVTLDARQDASITPTPTEPATPSQAPPTAQPSPSQTPDPPNFTDEEYAMFGSAWEARVRRLDLCTFVRRADEVPGAAGRRWVSWTDVPGIMAAGAVGLSDEGVLLGCNQLDVQYVAGLADPCDVHWQDEDHRWMLQAPTPRGSVEPGGSEQGASEQSATEQGQQVVDGILEGFVGHLTTYRVELLDRERLALRKWLQGVLDRQRRDADAADAVASDSESTRSTGSQKRGREDDDVDSRSAGEQPIEEGGEDRTAKRLRRSPRIKKVAKAGVGRR